MVKVKQLKKLWYPIIAPKVFGSGVLGETTVYDPQAAVGKVVMVNLMAITGNPKQQNTKLKFKIAKMVDNKAMADLIGYELVSSSTKRLVRRNVEKIDMSFTCMTQDKVAIRIKPMLIARLATVGSVAASLRKLTVDFITKYTNETKFETLILDLTNRKMQDLLKRTLAKVYPLKACEIRSLGIASADEVKEMPTTPETTATNQEKPSEPEQEQSAEPEQEVEELEAEET